FIGVPDQVYGGDISYLILNIGGFIAVFIVALLFVPRLYRAGTVTIYGFMAALPLCLLMFGEKSPTTEQLVVAICLIAAVGTFYTTMGGVRAVVWVDA